MHSKRRRLLRNNVSYLCSELRQLSQFIVWLWTGWLGFDPWQGQRIFLLASVLYLLWAPTQPPIQWVPGVLSLSERCDWGMTLITHPHLVPSLRKSKSCTSSPPSKHLGSVLGRALLYLFCKANWALYCKTVVFIVITFIHGGPFNIQFFSLCRGLAYEPGKVSFIC
jgi:hypothetical protein